MNTCKLSRFYYFSYFWYFYSTGLLRGVLKF